MSIDSRLLTADHLRQLQQWIGRQTQPTLLFRATRDEFNREKFYELCENKGPTIVVGRVKENSIVVGGFTAVPWTRSGGNKHDATAFLFNNRADPTTLKKFAVKNASKAARHNFSHFGRGPGFGSAYDLCFLFGEDSGKSGSGIGSYESDEGKRISGRDDYSFTADEVETFAI